MPYQGSDLQDFHWPHTRTQKSVHLGYEGNEISSENLILQTKLAWFLSTLLLLKFSFWNLKKCIINAENL